MNWQNHVNASECISLYKTVSSEDVVGMVDKCKEKSKITFYKTFCIRTLTLIILYIWRLGNFLVSRKSEAFLHFFKCMYVTNSYVNNVLCAFYLDCLNKRKLKTWTQSCSLIWSKMLTWSFMRSDFTEWACCWIHAGRISHDSSDLSGQCL